ncbi:hypothetical protein [Nocardioides pakistanensis]
MARLSHLDAERDLQKYIVLFLGWAGIALLILGVAAIGFELQEVSGDAEGPGEWVPLRAAMGAVAVLISLRLPLLVRRHRDDISRINGLKGQYLTAAVVTAVLPVPGSAFFWWAALPASAVGLVSLVLAARVPKIPVEEMTETIDYRNPEAWGGPTFLGERFVFLKVMAISFVLTSALVIALILFAT